MEIANRQASQLSQASAQFQIVEFKLNVFLYFTMRQFYIFLLQMSDRIIQVQHSPSGRMIIFSSNHTGQLC